MVSVLKDKIVKTQKEHTCWGCAEKFPKGTQLRCVTTVDDGITSSYWCRICDVTWLENRDFNDDGIGLGEVKEFDGWYDNFRLLPRTF